MAHNNVINIETRVVTGIFFMPESLKVTAAQHGKAKAEHKACCQKVLFRPASDRFHLIPLQPRCLLLVCLQLLSGL